jgi:dTDP-L-rhamnose 4-epimerase
MPGTIYGVAKIACEQWLRILGHGSELNWSVLRLFATYGAGHRPSLEQGIVNIMLTQLFKGNRVVVKGSLMRRRDLIYVDDVATAIVQALSLPAARGQIINVGTGVAVTIGEMIGALCDTLQRPRNTVQIIEETGTIGDPFSNVADITQMKKILAFEPEFGLEAGLQAFVSAYVTRMNQTINS